MNYGLYDDSIKPLMTISAETEDEAWKKLKKAGIRNKSNLLRLIEIG